MLASASYDGTIRVWNTAAGKIRQIFESYTGWANTITFSPDGTMLASASFYTIRLWDTATGKPPRILKSHTGRVNAITFSPDGTMLASRCVSGIVQLWDTATGNACKALEGHTDWISAIALSLDRAMLTTDRGSVHVNSRDVTTHSFLASQVGIENEWIVCNGNNVLWLPPEYRSHVSAVYATKVAIGSPSGQVLLFELDIF
jgi:WD40 repeat protein